MWVPVSGPVYLRYCFLDPISFLVFRVKFIIIIIGVIIAIFFLLKWNTPSIY